MSLVKQTTSGENYLEKIVSAADKGILSSVQKYEKQVGSDGASSNTVYTLEAPYIINSNTLMVFVNGQKAENVVSASDATEYEETDTVTITFGASLQDTDVIEFIVVGAYIIDATDGMNLKLDDLQTPDDNTDLNATSTYHGLLPKLSNDSDQYLNGIGGWANISSANVSAAGAVMLSNYEAGTFLYATDNDTPLPKTPSEVRAILDLEIGTDVLAQQTIGIADNNLLEVDGSPSASQIAVFTANGLNGASQETFKLDAFGEPDDNTDLNATSTYHGLLPKLSNDATQYIGGTGSWSTISVLSADVGIGGSPGSSIPTLRRCTINTSTGAITTGDGPDLMLNGTDDDSPDQEFIALKVWNAVFNDIADFQQLDDELVYGKCYYDTETGAKICNERCQISVIGVASDTFGYALGVGNGTVPIAVTGWVLAYVDKEYKMGVPLTNNENGILTEMTLEEKQNYPERILAIYKKKEESEFWGPENKKILVNDRHWVKVK